MQSNNWGVVYVAYGRDYFLEAENSARSMRMHNDLPCVCFCDQDPGVSDVFNQIIIYEDVLVNRNYKIRAILESPFDRTLYIDTDTYVAGNLLPVFQLLDQFDIALAHAAKHFGNSPSSATALTDEIPKAFIEFNGGVIFYKKSDAAVMVFKEWLDRYNTTSRKLDQPTLRESIYFSQARIYVLPPEYNLTFAGPVFLEGSAKILHGRFGRENRVMPMSKYARIASKLNKYTGRRVFIPGIGLLSMRISPKRFGIANLKRALKRRIAKIQQSFLGRGSHENSDSIKPKL